MMRSPLTSGRRPPLLSGYTLVEICVATAMLSAFSAGIMAAHSHILGLLRTSRDNISASQSLQQRAEQMRIANWLQITDAAYLKGTLLASGTTSSDTLTAPVETISVSPYPAKVGATPAVVTRQNGATQTITSNSALKDEQMVRVDMQLSWRGFPRNRQRVRAATAIIAKGGVAK